MVRIFISATIVFFLLSGLKTSVLANKLNDIIEVNLLQGWREDNGTHISGLEIKKPKRFVSFWLGDNKTMKICVILGSGQKTIIICEIPFGDLSNL